MLKIKKNVIGGIQRFDTCTEKGRINERTGKSAENKPITRSYDTSSSSSSPKRRGLEFVNDKQQQFESSDRWWIVRI